MDTAAAGHMTLKSDATLIKVLLAGSVIVGILASACSSPDQSSDPQKASQWIVQLCSTIEAFNQSLAPLSNGGQIEGIDERAAYAQVAAQRISLAAGEALEALAALEPPPSARSLQTSVEHQMAAIQREAEHAVRNLPVADSATEIRALTVAIVMAAEEGEERIATSLRRLSSDLQAGLNAVNCPLVR